MLMGYITPSVWGVPNTSKWGTRTKVAHMWADWLHHPCRLGGPQSFTAGNKVESGPRVGGLGTLPLPSGGPQRFGAGDGIGSGPHVCGMATSPLPSGGSPTLQISGDKNRSGPHLGRLATSRLPSRWPPTLQCGKQSRKWATCGRIGYITLAV